MAQCQSPEELMKLISRIVDAMINQYLLCGTLQGGLVACGENAYLPKDTEVVLCRQLYELVQKGIDTGEIVAPTVVEVRYEGSTLILHLANGENLTLDLKPLIDGVIDQAFIDCNGEAIHVGTALATCANLTALKTALETQLAELDQKVDNNKALTDQEIANVKAQLEQALADVKAQLESQIAANKELAEQADEATNQRITDWIADITERMTLLDESITNKIDAATAAWANTVLQELIELFLEVRQVYHDESLDGDGHEAAPLKVNVEWLRQQVASYLPELVTFKDCCGNDIAIGDVLVTCECLDTQLTLLTNELKAYAEAQAAAALEAAELYADEGDARTLAEAKAYADAGDANTLNAANAHADAGDASTLADANAYTDEQIANIPTANSYTNCGGQTRSLTDDPIVSCAEFEGLWTTLSDKRMAVHVTTGSNPIASDVSAVALGRSARAASPHSVSIGFAAGSGSDIPEAAGSVAVGSNTTAIQGGAALGYSALAGAGAIAAGEQSRANGSLSVAVGRGADASFAQAIAVGANAKAGNDALAIGHTANAALVHAIAIGKGAQATGSLGSIALGGEATATGTSGSIAIGRNAVSSAAGTVTIGSNASSVGERSTTVGSSASAEAGAVAVGNEASAAAIYNVAIGWKASAVDQSSTALGGNASAALASIAIGRYTNALGESSAALGNDATASGAFSVTLGHNTHCVGDNSTVLGSKAKVINTAHANSTLLGANTIVTAANQVQLGDSQTTTYAYGAVQDRSDRRDKAEIQDLDLGLEFINKLTPRKYKWDYREDYIKDKFTAPDRESFITTVVVEATEETPEHEVVVFDQEGYDAAVEKYNRDVAAFYENPVKDGSHVRNRFHAGLIADELKSVMDELGVDFAGYQHHSTNGTGYCVKSIGYTELIAPLIKAVQELSAEVQALKAAQGK